MNKYVIPIMTIQDKLMSIEKSPEFHELEMFCTKNLSKNPFVGSPGQEEFYFHFDFELERQWYPVLVTNDRWLASRVMEKCFNSTKKGE